VYVDYTNGTDSAGYGRAMSTPFKTLGYAFTSLAGSTKSTAIICRRGEQEIRSSNLTGNFNGDEAFPNILTSWPRPASGYVGRFFPNSARVESISPADLTELGNEARFIIAPNGIRHLVAKVLDSNTMLIDPEYKDAEVATNFTFEQDYLYPLLSTGITGADLQATWDADTNDIYSVFFNGSYYWTTTNSYLDKFNIAVTGCIGSSYLMQDHGVKNSYFRNCLYKCKMDDASLWYAYRGRYVFDGCVFEGLNAVDTDQNGILCTVDDLVILNSVFVSMGGRTVFPYGGTLLLDNVKAPLDGYYLYRAIDGQQSAAKSSFINCCFSGTAGSEGSTYGGYYQGTNLSPVLNVTNYNRVVGDDRTIWPGAGHVRKINSSLVPGITFRPGGSQDYLLMAQIYRWSLEGWGFRSEDGIDSDLRHGRKVLEHQFIVPSGTVDIRYYVQSSGNALTLDDVWLEVGSCPGTYWSPVNTIIYKSSGGISARSSTSDWSQYVYISGLTVASGYLTAKLFYSKYGSTAAQATYIDPLPEIDFV